jgi:hypothetical protein
MGQPKSSRNGHGSMRTLLILRICILVAADRESYFAVRARRLPS